MTIVVQDWERAGLETSHRPIQIRCKSISSREKNTHKVPWKKSTYEGPWLRFWRLSFEVAIGYWLLVMPRGAVN